LLPLLLFCLAGCASQSSERVVDLIQAELETMVEANEKGEQVPDLIANALMPPVNEVLDSYDPATERFDVAVRDSNAQEFFPSLVKDTPYNLVVHPELTGNITLDLKGVTIDEVLYIVRDLYGYDFKKTGNFYRILPSGIRTEVFQVNYLNIRRSGGSEIQVSAGQITNAGGSGQGSDTRGNNSSSNSGSQQGSSGLVGTRITTETNSDFWRQLTDTLTLIVGNGEGRAVVTTPDAGMVVVRAEPDELIAVEEYLRRAELIMQRQVVLEAKILEVILNEGHSQGIKWSSMSELTDNVDINGNPTKSLSLGQSSRGLVSADVGGIFSATLKTDDFDMFVEMLSTQGDVQVLSSPRISTINNQKAVIKVGSDEFFVTEIRVDENNNVNSTDTTNTDVELTPFFSGIALDVTPQISESGRIILHVHPSISEVEDQIKVVSLGDRELTLPLALSTIRETDSIIGAENGQVVVIGGLIRNVKQRNVASVPVLGQLPLMGSMFRQKQAKQTRSELVILIRPIMANHDQMQKDIGQTLNRFTSLGEFVR
jgi:MSHA biogenesis protein MshL